MRFRHILVIILWVAAASLLSLKVDVYNHTDVELRQTYDTPVFMRMLGEGRSIVSSLSLLEADRYLHGGVGDQDEDHDSNIVEVSREKDTDSYDTAGTAEKKADISPFNILFRMSEETGISEHKHLQGKDIREIIPWIYYSAEVDPHNVLAYTLAGYYVIDRFGKVDEGLAFLRKGLKNNPDSWEINAELGRVYFQYTKNYSVAVEFLSKAWTLMQTEDTDKFQRRYVLSFLARSYEALGQTDKALPIYKRLNELFPRDTNIKNKIQEMSKQM